MGPVRYKTLGYREYGTTSFTRASPAVLKPVTAVGGFAVDVVVTVVDTPVNILYAIPNVLTEGGPDGSGCGHDLAGIVFMPFWYAVELWNIPSWPQYQYQRKFGAPGFIGRIHPSGGAPTTVSGAKVPPLQQSANGRTSGDKQIDGKLVPDRLLEAPDVSGRE